MEQFFQNVETIIHEQGGLFLFFAIAYVVGWGVKKSLRLLISLFVLGTILALVLPNLSQFLG